MVRNISSLPRPSSAAAARPLAVVPNEVDFGGVEGGLELGPGVGAAADRAVCFLNLASELLTATLIIAVHKVACLASLLKGLLRSPEAYPSLIGPSPPTPQVSNDTAK